MPLIPSFATDRLILRPASPGDLESIVALATDAEVMKFPGQGKPQSREQACAWTEIILSDARHGFAAPGAPAGTPGTLIAIERETQAFVGMFVMRLLPGPIVAAIGSEFCPAPCLEVGFILAKEFWNRGFATEGAAPLIKYSHENLGLKEVYAIVDVLNAPSNRVLQKLGLKEIKLFTYGGNEMRFLSIAAPA